jgi:hypothetical protein
MFLGRWVLVKLERPLAGYDDADNRLNQFANAPGVVIASPVFHHTTMPGGYMTITPDILVRVAPGLRDKAMEVVGVKAPHLGVFNPSLGNMAGAVHLRSAAKNGFDVLAEANRLSLDPAFAWAEPDIRQSMDMLYTPDDPDYPSQWQHSNDGSNGGVSTRTWTATWAGTTPAASPASTCWSWTTARRATTRPQLARLARLRPGGRRRGYG